MRVRLMHSDRDFESTAVLWQSLFRRNNTKEVPLSRHELSLIQDLGLNVLLNAMAKGDEFLLQVSRKTLLSGVGNDIDTVLYRQEITRDCLTNQSIVRSIYEFSVDATEPKSQWWGLSSRYPYSLLHDSIDQLSYFLAILKKLRTIAETEARSFGSQGFTNLFSMLRRELSDVYLATVERQLAELKFPNGVLLSSELGDWNESAGLKLCQGPENGQSWLDRILGKGPSGYTFHLHERDEAGAQILSEMRNRGIARVVLALADSAEHVLNFFKALRTEMAFYIGCLNLYERLAAKGEPTCFPRPTVAGERHLKCSALYDPCLSLQIQERVIGNSLNANSKSLIAVTGANQGGKSTFLRSVGMAQVMMQCGMFVAAESFEGELCPALFTHFKREEDAEMKSGKFDEELARMSEIADRISANSMLLFNESFAATNEREGSEIAKQIVSALLEKNMKVFFVTHLYSFARDIFDRHWAGALFLRAERSSDGTRTFRMIEGEPLETSFGADLYRKTFPSEGSPEVQNLKEQNIGN